MFEIFRKVSLFSHYSKSQIFVQKFNFDKTPTFSRVFHANLFWQFFPWNQICQQLKSLKPQHFHEFFKQKNRDRHFFREIKLEFLNKGANTAKKKIAWPFGPRSLRFSLNVTHVTATCWMSIWEHDNHGSYKVKVVIELQPVWTEARQVKF